jgi:DNA (cytosine-5)-methyltransferase 1
MRYLSICSGIEAATVAWHDLGWEAAAFSEIEKFPRDLLQYHYPDVPCHGDFTTIGENDYGAIDLLVGGTPCQSFSVAGLRKGFADDRGNLTLAFLQLLKRKTPKWVVWENVPGVLSHDGGRTFATFLRGLGECGYGFAYRVLDAQYFGVPQRRRRVFVVGCLGDWRSPAKVLFEPESLSGDITPQRKKGEDIASSTRGSLASGKHNIGTLMANCGTKQWLGNQEAFSGDYFVLAGNTIDRQPENGGNGTGYSKDVSYTLTKTDRHAIAMGFSESAGVQSDIALTIEGVPTLTKSHSMSVYQSKTVRRLTPLECERLQGFPDGYTNIPGVKDGPRYAALGNSMAVPVMRWIGERIKLIDDKM